ncbi:MAG: Tetratricopeptide repeat protein [Deltaproteobacteria bacterium]|nr:Tetratricopeptide repeat protein [Deltaproteobacteria bacterium]
MNKLSLAILGVLLASSPAVAQKAKYTRNSDVKVDVKLSERVKPIQAKAPDPKNTQPTLSADDVLSIEGLVGNIRGEQEQILAELIQNTPDAEVEEKSDYYFRLGELYAKQQRYWRLKGVELAIQSDNAKGGPQKAKLKNDSAAAGNKAKDYLIKAVKTYKGLTDNDAFRNYPKMDMALFYYGYTLQGGKYMKEARAVYDKLLKNYPNSKFVPEAHLAFADYYFEAGQLADAESRYRQVLKFPKSSAYWYAMYKMGWIHLNLQRFQEALETFFNVAQATKNDKKQDILNRAAKKDFVRAYAEIGKADKAYPAFQRVDNKFAFDMLSILADLYLGQGKSDKAIYVYQEMMKTRPTDKNVCLWQYNIAHAMLSMAGANNSDKVKEIENLVKLFGALKGKKVLPVAEAQECHDNAAAMSGELARAYHSESAKTKNPETLAYAEKLYKVYLEVFPDAEDYAQTQYFYAELIWSRAENEKNLRLQTEMWENAALAFTDVVKGGKVDAKQMKEAAYAAVLGWKNALNVDPRIKQQADKVEDIGKDFDKIPPPKPIPPREEKMIAAFDIYINYIKDPKDDELVGMKFLKANIYRRYNQFDKAIPLFMDILDKHRQHETAEYSANLLLDTYNRMGKYDEMLVLVDKLDADKKFLEGKDDLNVTLGKIKAQSMRKKAEKIEKEAKESKDFGKYVACGQAYLDIYNRNPEATENDEVLYNALTCYQEGKSVGAAIQMYSLLKQYYPKSKLMPRALGRIGQAYGDIAFYDKASAALEEYSKNYAGEADAHKSMSDAVFFRKGIGDDDKAIEDTNVYIAKFGKANPTEGANALFSLTSVYEKKGDPDALIKHLNRYIHEYPEAKGGADRIVVAWTKIGQTLWTQSCPVKQVDGSCVKIVRERAINLKKATAAFAKVTPPPAGGEAAVRYASARHHFAQAKFAEADKDFEAYLTLKFPANLNFDPDPARKAIKEKSLKRFNEWIEQRTKVGGGATKKYEDILGIKDNATSIAAAARLAQISQNLSDALFSAEIPKDVRTGEFADDKVEAFCDQMTTVAEPLDLRALNGYSVCLTKSTELGWFSEWSKMCEHELGQIKPEEFPTASELRGEPNLVAPVTDVEPPIGKLE